MEKSPNQFRFWEKPIESQEDKNINKSQEIQDIWDTLFKIQRQEESSLEDLEGNKEYNENDGYNIIFSEEASLIKSKIKEMIELTKNNDIKAVIFLDKSARPISWVFSLVSRNILEKENRPEIKLINIGPEKSWLDERLSSEEFDNAVENMPEYNFLKKQWENLQNKNILIVDEFLSTGQSLKLAERIL